jgi:hypothetical protein
MNRVCVFTVLSLLAASGCSNRPPTTVECRALLADKAVVARCYGGEVWDGSKYIGDTNCFPFGPPEPVTGILLTQTETSHFFAGESKFAPAMLKVRGTWLDSEGPAKRVLDRERHIGPGAFRIEGMGRRPLCAAGYGNYGLYRNEVTLTRIFSITRLADPWGALMAASRARHRPASPESARLVSERK